MLCQRASFKKFRVVVQLRRKPHVVIHLPVCFCYRVTLRSNTPASSDKATKVPFGTPTSRWMWSKPPTSWENSEMAYGKASRGQIKFSINFTSWSPYYWARTQKVCEPRVQVHGGRLAYIQDLPLRVGRLCSHSWATAIEGSQGEICQLQRASRDEREESNVHVVRVPLCQGEYHRFVLLFWFNHCNYFF